MMTDDYKLVFVKPIGQNTIGYYEYDFYFSKNPDDVWGIDWDADFPNQIENMIPNEDSYDKVVRLKTIIPFFCMQENNSFSMRYVVEGILAVCFEDISEYEVYPEPYRIVFDYGESFHSVENKLSSRHQFFVEDEV